MAGLVHKSSLRKYSKLALHTALRIGAVYHLPSRQTEGSLRSLFFLLKLTADVPDHTRRTLNTTPKSSIRQWRVIDRTALRAS